ncbi:hypothetical protein NMY22_g2718 [Coprinellus aureogranulatus]|nr:hypothetical protein NMY22_g2718 [Coprinellus aureogranulatus]
MNFPLDIPAQYPFTFLSCSLSAEDCPAQTQWDRGVGAPCFAITRMPSAVGADADSRVHPEREGPSGVTQAPEPTTRGNVEHGGPRTSPSPPPVPSGDETGAVSYDLVRDSHLASSMINLLGKGSSNGSGPDESILGYEDFSEKLTPAQFEELQKASVPGAANPRARRQGIVTASTPSTSAKTPATVPTAAPQTAPASEELSPEAGEALINSIIRRYDTKGDMHDAGSNPVEWGIAI